MVKDVLGLQIKQLYNHFMNFLCSELREEMNKLEAKIKQELKKVLLAYVVMVTDDSVFN